MQINENARLCSFQADLKAPSLKRSRARLSVSAKYRNHTVTALLISTMNNEYSTGTSNTCCCKAPTRLDVTISTASGPFWMPISSAMGYWQVIRRWVGDEMAFYATLSASSVVSGLLVGVLVLQTNKYRRSKLLNK